MRHSRGDAFKELPHLVDQRLELDGHHPAFLSAGVLEAGQGFLDDGRERGPLEVDVVSCRWTIPRPRRAGPARRRGRTTRPLAAPRNWLELVAIAFEGHEVQAVVLGATGSIDSDRELDGAALDVLADQSFQVVLEGGDGVAEAGTHLEVAVIDAAQLDADGVIRVLRLSFAVTSHAKEHRHLDRGKEAGRLKAEASDFRGSRPLRDGGREEGDQGACGRRGRGGRRFVFESRGKVTSGGGAGVPGRWWLPRPAGWRRRLDVGLGLGCGCVGLGGAGKFDGGLAAGAGAEVEGGLVVPGC